MVAYACLQDRMNLKLLGLRFSGESILLMFNIEFLQTCVKGKKVLKQVKIMVKKYRWHILPHDFQQTRGLCGRSTVIQSEGLCALTDDICIIC